jgi:hypothetical protein
MKKDNWNNRPGEDEMPESPIDVMMERLAVEKAPASLSRRLKRIPREQGRKEGSWSWLIPGQFPRWAMAPAFAAVPLLVVAVVLMQPRQPSPADVEQARQDLAVAFTYLDKVGYRTGNEIQTVIGDELRHSVKDKLSKHIPFTEQSRKEETI